MLQISNISSYSAAYTQGFGGHAKVDKVVKNVTPKISADVKYKITLGTILAGIFGTKAKQEITQTPKTKHKNTYREEKIYDKHGRLTEILKYSNADDVLSIKENINPDTGKITEKIWYRKNGINEQLRELYDKAGDKQNLISYNKLGKVEWIETYGKKSKNPIEVTWFDKKGNMSEQVKCDEETGDVENRFIFDSNANLVEISDVAGLTGNIIKKTNFHEDGSKTIREFDLVTGEQTGKFEFDEKNKLVDFNVKNERVRRDLYKELQNETDDNDNIKAKQQKYSQEELNKITNFLINREEMEYSE